MLKRKETSTAEELAQAQIDAELKALMKRSKIAAAKVEEAQVQAAQKIHFAELNAAEAEEQLQRALKSANERKAKRTAELTVAIEKAKAWTPKRPALLTTSCIGRIPRFVEFMMCSTIDQTLVDVLRTCIQDDRVGCGDDDLAFVEWYSSVDGSYHNGYVMSCSLTFVHPEVVHNEMAAFREWKPVRPALLPTYDYRCKIDTEYICVDRSGPILVDLLELAQHDQDTHLIEWRARDGLTYKGRVEYVSIPIDFPVEKTAIHECGGGSAIHFHRVPNSDSHSHKSSVRRNRMPVKVMQMNIHDMSTAYQMYPTRFASIQWTDTNGAPHTGFVKMNKLTWPRADESDA